MKKTFSFNASNKNRDRQTESIKHEIKKYIARERRKTLPKGVDFWDFDCKLGLTPDQSKVIYLKNINKLITELERDKEDSFYLEILVKSGVKKQKEQTVKKEAKITK